MAIQYEQKTFKKVGKRAEGQPAEEYVANQLTAESLSIENEASFLRDILTVCGNDMNVAREAVFDGLNAHLRRLAGGSDEASKAARYLVKLGLAKGKSVTEVAEAIRSGKMSLG